MRTGLFFRAGRTILLSGGALALTVMACFHPPGKEVPIFPGAQGFGINTPAGRGGKIIKVTTLADGGRGSLREALERQVPRIVVFEVGGTISLKEELTVSSPYLTVAGQTAPSPGITLKGAGLIIATQDVLIQHLKIRCGDDPNGPDPESRDALKIVSPSEDVVVDHVSASWATDENMSVWAKLDGSTVENVTIMNSIISEGLNNSIHPEGAHSKGLLVGNNIRNLALIGNLFAHNKTRNPLVYGNDSIFAAGNLFYNTGSEAFFHISDGWHQGPTQATIVNNIFVAGPDTPPKACAVKVGKDTPRSQVFLAGNRYSGSILCHSRYFDPRVPTPLVWIKSFDPSGGSKAETDLLETVGARPADRDPVDLRVVHEVSTRTGRIIDSPKQVGGWPYVQGSYRPFRIPPEPDKDSDGDGYTDIEEILYRMALRLEQVPGRDRSGTGNEASYGY
jgi:hypothetical protein